MITKIDPQKPLGQLKLTCGAKRIRSTVGSVYGTGIGTGVTGMGGSYSGGMGTRMDPTYTNAYRNIVDQMNRRDVGTKNSTGFFVSEGNVDTGGDGGTGGRRHGVDLGEIPTIGEMDEDKGQDGGGSMDVDMDMNYSDPGSPGFGDDGDD